MTGLTTGIGLQQIIESFYLDKQFGENEEDIYESKCQQYGYQGCKG